MKTRFIAMSVVYGLILSAAFAGVFMPTDLWRLSLLLGVSATVFAVSLIPGALSLHYKHYPTLSLAHLKIFLVLHLFLTTISSLLLACNLYVTLFASSRFCNGHAWCSDWDYALGVALCVLTVLGMVTSFFGIAYALKMKETLASLIKFRTRKAVKGFTPSPFGTFTPGVALP